MRMPELKLLARINTEAVTGKFPIYGQLRQSLKLPSKGSSCLGFFHFLTSVLLFRSALLETR